MRHLIVILVIALVQLLGNGKAQAAIMTHYPTEANELVSSNGDKQSPDIPQLDQDHDIPVLDAKDPNSGFEIFNRESKQQARSLHQQLRLVNQHAQQQRAAIKTTSISLQRQRCAFNYCEARATVADGYVFAIRHIII